MYVIKQLFSLTSLKKNFYQAIFLNYNTSMAITSLLIRIERIGRNYKFLKKHNIGCPSFTDDFKNWKKYKFPMFVKKKTGAGNKGYIVARSENDLKPILAHKNLIIQEYLHTTKEYSACIYSNNNYNTRILIFEREY